MSRLTLYYKTEIKPERNALVDDIEEYLAESAYDVFEDVQYQKMSTSFSIKLDMHQSKQSDQDIGNYAKLEQDGRN